MANQLSDEKSPYLLEHAKNPVNWYVWGDKAFKKAKNENIPLFVSIGYAACHWCHVMRRESFENQEIADLMNKFFVNIKIDREERPDIDHQLQLAHQMLNRRSGGWPLSIWLTPDKKPFYAGTYFPSEPKFGMPGFKTVLNAIQDAYINKNELLLKQANSLESNILNISKNESKSINVDEINSLKLIERILENYDDEFGGFGTQPKFPNETTLFLLLHESARLNHKTGIEAVEKSLLAMIKGGIYDQLGGGIARYSVDEKWLVPHFEKMLYNQALIINLLSEAYRITQNFLFKEKIKEIIKYLMREMLDTSNGFYSSQNADSEGVEGKYYVWNYDEIKNILSDTEFTILKEHFGFSLNGNWENTNVLYIFSNEEEISNSTGLDIDYIKEIIHSAKEKLFAYRSKRIKPSTDTKIITSWNGLLFNSLIQSVGLFIGEQEYDEYVSLIKNGLDFFRSIMFKDKILYRIYVEENVQGTGFLDDYQYLISALLEFYQISLDETYLEDAKQLFDLSIELFMNEATGKVYYSSEKHETVISRFEDVYDTPLPSPTAFTIQNAMKISYLFENDSERYGTLAEKIIKKYQNLYTKTHPNSCSTFLYSHLLYHNYFYEVVIIQTIKSPKFNVFLLQINNTFIPFRFQFNLITGLEIRQKWLKDKIQFKSKNCVYLCRNFVCSLPIYSIEDFNEFLLKT